MDIYATIRTYWAELAKFSYIFENVCFHLNRPKNVILGQLLFIKGSLRLIRTYWAEIEKVDIFAIIRTYWDEVLKDPQLAEI